MLILNFSKISIFRKVKKFDEFLIILNFCLLRAFGFKSQNSICEHDLLAIGSLQSRSDRGDDDPFIESWNNLKPIFDSNNLFCLNEMNL